MNMSEEERIRQELLKNFNFLGNGIRVQRQRRIYAEVSPDKFFNVFDYAIEALGFCILSGITGMDEGEKLSFIYHLSSENGIVLSIKTGVAKNDPVIKTITSYFPGAEIYERELVDLLGTKVEGLKKGKRYPLPDNWPEGQYPLRKDWKKEMLQEGSKNA